VGTALERPRVLHVGGRPGVDDVDDDVAAGCLARLVASGASMVIEPVTVVTSTVWLT
jgi:hypothetical protein